MATITKTQAADAIPELFLREAIGRLNEELMLTRMISRDASAEVANKGDSVRVTKRGTVTAKAKAAGSPVVPDAPANTKVSINLDQHWYVSWAMEDVVRAETIPDALAYIVDAIPALAETVESYFFGLYTSASAALSAYGQDVSGDILLEAGRVADVAKWPVGNRWAIVSAKDKKNLLTEDKLIDTSIRGELATVALRNATIGTIYGWNVLSSNLIVSTEDDGGTEEDDTDDITEYHNIIFNPAAFHMASRQLPPPPENVGALTTVVTDPGTGLTFRYVQAYSTLDQAMIHTVDVLFGGAVVDARLLQELRS